MNKTLLVFCALVVIYIFVIDVEVFGNQPTRAELATLAVQANWSPLTIKTMAENAPVYIDHKANFTGIPDFLQGLQYTLRLRKKIVTLSFRVKTSGQVYLCLFGNTTPKHIGQHREWKKCGKMRGPRFLMRNKWIIYQADVQGGEILTFPQGDKLGLTLAAKEITIESTRPLPEIPKVVSAHRSVVGKSVEGRSVECFLLGEGDDVIFILAAIHGDEHMGIPLVQRLAVYLHEHRHLLQGHKVILMPIANPDGVVHYSHLNANNVDLNRNFDAANWRKGKWMGAHALSEPEARIIKQLIQEYSPNRIVSIHQVVRLFGPKTAGMIDHDGPGEALAKHMAQYCKLSAKKWGTSPGSLGSYAGVDLGVPIITLELPKYDVELSSEHLWKKYGTALISAVVYPRNIK